MKSRSGRIALLWLAAFGFSPLLSAQSLLPPSPPPPATPHGFHAGAPPQDSSSDDPALPQGQIVVEVVGANEEPLPGIAVRLTTLFESIAQGNSKEEATGRSDAAGRVSFQKGAASLRFSHAIHIEHQGAVYDLPAFRLDEQVGHRARLHLYPVTRDLREAFIGLRGFVLIDLRDGNFHFDVVYRVINMSRSTWVPDHLKLDLPSSASGLELASEGNSPGFAEKAGGLELIGSYPPGQKDVRFQFQVASLDQEEQSFRLGVPPHLAELRVLVEAIPGMSLSVPGFDNAEPTRGPDGKRILITRRMMQPGQSELDSVRIDLSGLPVAGPARLVACALGLLIAGLGVAQAWRMRKTFERESFEDRARAKGILLAELVALEQAFSRDEVGPKTHEQARKLLLDALARLEAAAVSASPPSQLVAN